MQPCIILLWTTQWHPQINREMKTCFSVTLLRELWKPTEIQWFHFHGTETAHCHWAQNWGMDTGTKQTPKTDSGQGTISAMLNKWGIGKVLPLKNDFKPIKESSQCASRKTFMLFFWVRLLLISSGVWAMKEREREREKKSPFIKSVSHLSTSCSQNELMIHAPLDQTRHWSQLHTRAERPVKYYEVKTIQRPRLKGATSCLILLEDSIYKTPSFHLTTTEEQSQFSHFFLWQPVSDL